MEYEYEYDCEMEETNREITEECMEYQENMNRSEEEGWFYPDGDEEDLQQ